MCVSSSIKRTGILGSYLTAATRKIGRNQRKETESSRLIVKNTKHPQLSCSMAVTFTVCLLLAGDICKALFKCDVEL